MEGHLTNQTLGAQGPDAVLQSPVKPSVRSRGWDQPDAGVFLGLDVLVDIYIASTAQGHDRTGRRRKE